METMTSAFPLSTPSHNNVRLDNIIFYPGPASAKPREITPIDIDEWTDIDMSVDRGMSTMSQESLDL